MVLPGKCSSDEGSGSQSLPREYICAPLVLVNWMIAEVMVTQKGGGLRDAASLDLLVNTSAHPSRVCII